MKNNVFFGIAIRIIIMILFGMALTFITPELRTFFGDIRDVKEYSNYRIDPGWIWGARHYWYAWGVTLLFLLSLFNMIISVINLIKKNYPEIFK